MIDKLNIGTAVSTGHNIVKGLMARLKGQEGIFVIVHGDNKGSIVKMDRRIVLDSIKVKILDDLRNIRTELQRSDKREKTNALRAAEKTILESKIMEIKKKWGKYKEFPIIEIKELIKE